MYVVVECTHTTVLYYDVSRVELHEKMSLVCRFFAQVLPAEVPTREYFAPHAQDRFYNS